MTLVLAIGLALQVVAIVVALVMLRYAPANPTWIALLILLGLQAFRRIVDLAISARVAPAWLESMGSDWLGILMSTVVFLAMVLMLLDMRCRAHQAIHIQEVEGRYGELFERNRAPMLLMEFAGARIRDANDAAAGYYGYSREQMRGMHMSQLCPVPYPAVMEQVRKVESGQGDRLRISHVMADGSTRDVEVFSGLIQMEGDPLVYQIVIDVTERNQAQLELSRRNTDLEVAVAERTGHLDRAVQDLERALVVREQFMASMSHELRTPLNSIIGYSGVMLGGMAGDLNDEQRKQLNMVSRSGKHLLALINDVLNMAQLDAGAMHLSVDDFTVREIIDDAARIMGPLAAEKGLQLLVVHAAGDTAMRGDRTKVAQVLLNLLGNAVKFTHAGSVTIASNLCEDGCISFAVTDTGIGIPSGRIDAITEPFVQLHEYGGTKPAGVGLGLAISKRLALAMGGRLHVASSPGKGSTFTMWLPREAEVAEG